MLEILLFIIFFIVCVEATTELLSKSEFFNPFREFLFNRRKYKLFKFLHSVFDCGYCLSIWISIFYTIFFYLIIVDLISFYVLFLPIVLFFHRLSNILHFIIDRLWGEK